MKKTSLSGAAPVASGSGAKARAVPARRSSGKKVDEPPVSDDTRRVAFSLPVSVAERITELAAERGVPRSQVARSNRGARTPYGWDPGAFSPVDRVGRTWSMWVTQPSDAGGAPPEIPSAYVDDVEPSAASASAAGDAGGGAPGGTADTSAAEPLREPAPGSAASSGGVDSPGLGVPLVLAQPPSMFEQRNGLVLALVLLLGLLGIAGSLAAPRYAVSAPDPGAYGAGAYLVDRWTGRLWFCDSANRVLPDRYCAPFRRAVVTVAPATAVE